MKIKVNQLSVALYDNKPTLPANRWNEPSPYSEDYKNRFKLEMNFLGHFEPIKLRCALNWPPSQIRRYDYWRKHKDLFEPWAKRAIFIQDEIRAGRIKSSIPPLIGIPNQNSSYKTNKGKHFTWQVPVIPSLILAVQEQTVAERIWNITWLTANEERIFTFTAQDPVAEVPNKKFAPTSTRVSKAYNQPGEFESGLFMDTEIAKPGKKVDDEYERFKQEVINLLNTESKLAKMQADHLLSQNPEWARKLIEETK